MGATKNERIEVRVTAFQKDLIETAAALSGRSISDFSTTVLTERAEEVIKKERELRVDAASFDAFSEALRQPARTVDGLRDLLNRKPIFIDVA